MSSVYVAISSQIVATASGEDSLSEDLEKEVQETRKMVSALQVWYIEVVTSFWKPPVFL